MSASRYPLTMARDDLLPSGLAKIGRFATPVRAVLLTSTLMVIAIMALDVIQVAKLASSMQLFISGLLNLAVIVMRESRIGSYDPGQHLRILAKVAGRVDDADFMPQWLSARNEQEFKEVLLRDERFLSLQLHSGGRGGWMIGHSLDKLHLPHGCLVALVRRREDLIVPSGSTVLEMEDWVTIIGDPGVIQHFWETALASPPAPAQPLR